MHDPVNAIEHATTAEHETVTPRVRPESGPVVSDGAPPAEPRLRSKLLRTLAWFGVIASFPVWIASFAVAPFLPMSVAGRALVAAALYAAGEGLFWVGAIILGADVLRALKARTLGWLRRRGRAPAPHEERAPDRAERDDLAPR